MDGRYIRTPDQRLRVFVSSTMGELAAERLAIRAAIERLRLVPVMFEDGARPHPPRSLYRAYLDQSHVFLGVYWQRYGWIAEGERISGLEDEYRLAGERPRLLYIKEPAPDREERLTALIKEFQADDRSSYRRFKTTDELIEFIERDLALLLTERFEAAGPRSDIGPSAPPPVPLTRTLGREQEIGRLPEYLRAGTRLLTLTGPGGVGKTRLALELASSLRASYADRVYFVPLRTITTADLVGRSIVDRLGIRTEGVLTPEAAIAYQLGDQPALLVLDNLEQIRGVEPALRSLLERMPKLQILATSRRALRMEGEQEFPVLPLPAPGARSGIRLEDEVAVQLFVERARAINPAIVFDKDSLHAIAEICRRVDGLPLAIELAAARTRLMRPTELLSRLERGFEVLAAPSADRPEHQQTLRSTLEWSRDLLPDAERRLMARLSVFSGSWALEAAEKVCDVEGTGRIADALSGLLDSSLVLPSEDPQVAEPRFRMLQTVKAYAGEMLEKAGEVEMMLQRHIDWYAGFCHEAQPFLCGPYQRHWAARLDAERNNLRVAVSAALARNQLATVVDVVWGVAVFYEIRDAVDEPRAWIGEVAQRHPEFDELMHAKLKTMEAFVQAGRGDFTGSGDALAAAVEVFRRREMWFETAVTEILRADLQLRVHKDLASTRATLTEATRLFTLVGHDWGVARTEIMMALLVWTAGDVREAARHLERALEHARRIDNEPQIARALCLLSMLSPKNGKSRPTTLLRDAAQIVTRGRYRAEAAICLEALAASSFKSGRKSDADEALALSSALRRQLGLAVPQPVASVIASIRRKRTLDPATEQTAEDTPNVTFDFLTDKLLATSL